MLSEDKIGWHLSDQAHTDLKELRDAWGEDEYSDQSRQVKEYLCEFFGAAPNCAERFGTIARVGTTTDGGKILKMRWLRPGGGKRGGQRLVVVVFCEARKVVLCRALLRESDPTKAEIGAAAGLAYG